MRVRQCYLQHNILYILLYLNLPITSSTPTTAGRGMSIAISPFWRAKILAICVASAILCCGNMLNGNHCCYDNQNQKEDKLKLHFNNSGKLGVSLYAKRELKTVLNDGKNTGYEALYTSISIDFNLKDFNKSCIDKTGFHEIRCYLLRRN